MASRIAKELKSRYAPVAVIFTDIKPENAVQFKEGARWGCVVGLLTAAAKGKTAVFDRNTTPCGGGMIGLGFKDEYAGLPGGIEYFLSTGRGEGYPEGESYKKTPELAKAFFANLPKIDTPYTYVVFKPIEQVDPATEQPRLVVFYVNPDQLSALVVLANYDRPGNDNVTIPFAAGCQSIGIIPLREAQQEHPRAVVGMLDVSARPFVDPNILTFTVPYAMYLEMEANVEGSFFSKSAWRKVAARLPDLPSEDDWELERE